MQWKLLLAIFLLTQSCKVQKNVTEIPLAPKVENHTKGEMDIKVSPFGLNGKKITVCQIQKDGSINFNWPEIDLSSIKDSEFYMSSIKNVVGMTFCNEKTIEESNKTTKVVKVELSLYM